MQYGSPSTVRAADRLSIFCIGDSRTVGNFSTEYGGYRYGLFSKLRDYLGYDPRFFGSNFANGFILPLCGASGDTVAQCLTKVTTQSPLFPSANVIILDIGVNDAIVGTAPATIIAGVTSILAILRTDSPNAMILVTQTVDYNGFTAEVNAYNSALATAMALRSDYSASPAVAKTSVYDLNAVIGPYSVTYFANAGHLNATGYGIEATSWYNQIITVF